MSSYTAICHDLARQYGVSPGQIYRFGAGRFLALPEESRQIMAEQMRSFGRGGQYKVGDRVPKSFNGYKPV